MFWTPTFNMHTAATLASTNVNTLTNCIVYTYKTVHLYTLINVGDWFLSTCSR